jgi:hypothetical protein
MRFGSMLTAAVISMFVSVGAVGQELEKKVSLTYSLEPAPQVTITNNYSSPLTGMAIVISGTVGNHKTTQTIWLDSGLNFRHDRPLETSESRSFHVAHFEQPSTLQPQLMAITFEDHASAGDPQWLSNFHTRRKAAYDEIGAVTALLNQALAENQTNEQIISALNGMKDSLKASVPEVETRIAAGLVIETTVSNLERGGVKGAIGDPQKTIPAAIFPLFEEWRGALERFDNNVS